MESSKRISLEIKAIKVRYLPYVPFFGMGFLLPPSPFTRLGPAGLFEL